MSAPAALTASDQPLADAYDGLILDLDGVVQLDDEPVPEAVQVLNQLTERGLPQTYLTNNAARPPADVASRLVALGLSAREDQVLTSAMVAADALAQRLPKGSHVLVVGGGGLIEAVERSGLHAVDVAGPDVAAVVQGWSPDVGWRLLAEGAVAIRAGAMWIATNRDRTLPSPRGPLPGNGSLVAALTTATGVEPVVVGKPERGVFDAAGARLGGSSPLMVGDRLDTDIAGARAAGLPTLLVLTGVATPHDLLSAAPAQRPSYLGRDLRALLSAHSSPVVTAASATCGGVCVTTDGSVETQSGADAIDGLRAAAALAWAGHLREEQYADVLRQLDL